MNILDGRTLGTWFAPQRARGATNYFVVHWTGGSDAGDVAAQATRVYQTLVARGDSIHFVCCADGTLVQMASLDQHCIHAGSGYNDQSIGCEFVCPGSSGVVPTVSRPFYGYYGFTEAQVSAAAQLAQALLWKYGIAYLSSPVCVDDVLPPTFTQGVIGHLQVAPDDKQDPGIETMYQIRSKMIDTKLASVAGLGGAAFLAKKFLTHLRF